jgi:protein-tyrosine phosphatase
VKVNAQHLAWADIVFVMEKRHQQILAQRFSTEISNCRIVCLDIPDDYRFMDEELVTKSW